MTRAGFFSVAAAACLAAATPATAQYAAAIGKAHTAAAATSARSGQTESAQRQVAQTGAPANAAGTVGTTAKPATTAQPTAEAPAPADPKGYSYNPEGRRDPFVSLVRRGTDAAANATGPRKPGLPGLGVGEVTLKGTMASRGGYLGLLRGADAKTYIVRPGDRLLDGAVQAVTADAVVILQQVDDPLSVQKEREVRKTLRQTEEEAK
jgi:Tfp pilus assembly protein PilP